MILLYGISLDYMKSKTITNFSLKAVILNYITVACVNASPGPTPRGKYGILGTVCCLVYEVEICIQLELD